MYLTLRIPEYTLTSQKIARNCNSVQHVRVNCNVNSCEYLKFTVLAYLETPASKPEYITQTRSSVYAVFFLQHAL
jgi:hypothetical protein